MTNAEIIKAAMLLNGIIEESHTYSYWKSKGFQVQKGEKAAFKATIWKHTEKVINDGEDEDKIRRMFMKTASFFTASQVSPIV